MAWCPHCKQDRPIQRQTFDGTCSFCGKRNSFSHKDGCRGPVPGALDVCTHCNTPLFAKALDEFQYDKMSKLESQIEKEVTLPHSVGTSDEEWAEIAARTRSRNQHRRSSQNPGTSGCLVILIAVGVCTAIAWIV